MENTVFEKIILREIPAEIIHEDEHIIVIEDNQPQAPVHCLAITKTAYKDFSELDPKVFSALQEAIIKTAEITGITETGYRVVTNVGVDGGQSVFHLHFHILGGTRLNSTIG